MKVDFRMAKSIFKLRNRVECKMTDYQSRIKLNEIIFGAVGDGNFPQFCILHFAFCIQFSA